MRSKQKRNQLTQWKMALVGLLLILLVAACGQDAASSSNSAESSSSETGKDDASSGSKSDPLASVSDVAAPKSDEELIAMGEEIFQVKAGGVGCQACHGRDAQGDVGPNIVGKSAEAIQTQLDTNEAMQFIILSSQEIEAVAAYLGWLATQQ